MKLIFEQSHPGHRSQFLPASDVPVAALPEESLSAQAAEFQASTNDDTIGWIQIPNTNVDYPVVYKAGVENYAYYESLGYDKQYSKDGVIWADYE